MRWLLVGATLAAVLVGPRRADAQAKRLAVVKTSATLRVAPKASARGFALGLDKREGDGFDVEIVGARGDYYKVRNLPRRRCYSTFDDVSSFDMTFYVAKGDLLPVLTEQVSIDLGDGQRLEALPGVLSEDGKLRIVGVSTEVPLPADSIGTIYDGSGDVLVAKPTNGRLRAGFWSLGEVSVKSAFAVAALIEDVGGVRTATIERPCLRLHLVVKGDEADLARPQNFLGGVLSSLGSFTLPKGTALYWPNGKRAGTVRSETTISANRAGRITTGKTKSKAKSKGKTCFDRSLGTGNVTLCARAKSLKKIPTVGFGGIGLGGLGTGSSSRVSFGRIQVNGGLDKSIVRRYVRRQFRALRRCHIVHGGPNRSMRSGRMEVRIEIDQKGRVSSASLRRNRTGSKKLGACVLAVVRTIRFPRPSGTTLVKARLPLLFLRR